MHTNEHKGCSSVRNCKLILKKRNVSHCWKKTHLIILPLIPDMVDWIKPILTEVIFPHSRKRITEGGHWCHQRRFSSKDLLGNSLFFFNWPQEYAFKEPKCNSNLMTNADQRPATFLIIYKLIYFISLLYILVNHYTVRTNLLLCWYNCFVIYIWYIVLGLVHICSKTTT